MRKNQTNIISILFSALLMLPLLLVVIFQIWEFYLSHTIKQRMENESIQTLKVRSQDVLWKEEGREVTVNGEYFDLISWTYDKGYYSFTGVFDEQETAINNVLKKQNFSENIIIELLMIGQCFAVIIYLISNESVFHLKRKKFGYFFNRYKYLFLRIIAPPPRNASFIFERN